MVDTPTHLLTTTCNVYSPVQSQDDGGSPVRSMTRTGINVPCRVKVNSGNESVSAGRPETRYSHAVYLPPDADVEAGDEIRVNSLQLDVQAVVDFDLAGTLLRADCEEVKP